MLQRTGFVLPDVGIYTIMAFANKDDPADVTSDHLDRMADYLQAFYSNGVGKSLASTTFPNSGFVQSSYDRPEFQYKRQAWADFVLRGHQQLDLEPILNALEKPEYRAMVLRGKPDAPRCTFSGAQAYLRVHRAMVPMINGQGIMNFSPMGEAGLPVSDLILLAIHAMPLGCIITQGALLAVESEDPALMFAFARANLENNRRLIHLANERAYEGFPNLSSYKTRLIDVLVQVQPSRQLTDDDRTISPSVTAYHFSNYGSNARIMLYTLPSPVVQFVRDASKGERGEAWRQIVSRAWHQDKSESEELEQKKPKLTRRNLLYEDLFSLPEDAQRFLRTYFLRQPLRAFKGDPRDGYEPFRESDLISWNLTALFLKGIMNMQKSRVDQIRNLGDRLADHIQDSGDRKLLRELYYTRAYWQFRAALLRAIRDYRGEEPLCPFDTYAQIFEESEEFERQDWSLARDLLLIRIFEQLQRGGYLAAVADDLKVGEAENVSAPTD